MRQGTCGPAGLACLSTLAACAAAGLALTAAGSASAAFNPDLAVDPTGNASFGWVRSDGTDDLIQERRRSTDGTLSDTQDLSAAGQDAVFPQVAVAPNGTATFVWYRSDGTNTIIQTRSRAPDSPVRSAVQNLSAAHQDADMQQVAVDPDGNATFVWRRFSGTDYIIQTRRRLANGTLEATQSISGSDQHGEEPQVAVAPDGTATFVWVRDNGLDDIVQTRRRLANGTFTSTQTLSTTDHNDPSPQVAVDPNGNASVVWVRDNGPNDIIQARRRLANGTLEATQDLSAAGRNAFGPQVAVDPNGNATFVWTRPNGTNEIVQTRRRLANATLEATKDLSAAGQNASDAQVALAPDGAASFAWRRFNGTHQIIQTRRRLANGTLTTPQNLSAAGGHASQLGVGVDQNDNATFTWVRSSVIQTRRRTSSGFGATVDLSN